MDSQTHAPRCLDCRWEKTHITNQTGAVAFLKQRACIDAYASNVSDGPLSGFIELPEHVSAEEMAPLDQQDLLPMEVTGSDQSTGMQAAAIQVWAHTESTR